MTTDEKALKKAQHEKFSKNKVATHAQHADIPRRHTLILDGDMRSCLILHQK